MSDFKLPQRPNTSDDWTDEEYIKFLESVERKAEEIISIINRRELDSTRPLNQGLLVVGS